MTEVMATGLPNGLHPDRLAESCAALFGWVATGRAVKTLGAGPGWTMVGRYAVAMYLSDTFSSVTVDSLAASLRKGYARGYGRAGAEVEWEQVPPAVRLAWEAVARHVAWAVGDSNAKYELDSAAAHRARWAEAEARRRGITRAK